MLIFCYIFLLVIGLSFYIVGAQTIPKEVRTSWAPQDIEMLQEQFNNSKYVGQIIMVICAIIAVFYII